MTAKSPAQPVTGEAKKSKKRKIPAFLIRETIDGVPFYYAGYKEVLNKKKTLEDIMPDSGLQSIIKAYLMRLFAQFLDWKLYQPVAGEVGNHLDHRNNLALDVAIYDKSILTPAKITNKYIDVYPKVVIEIDLKVSLEDTSIDLFAPFVLAKSKKLLSFGTERIIWVFTKSNTILVVKPGNTWEVFQMNDDVLVMDGVVMNIGTYLEEEGIEI
ncbi:MAG: Uma2 family endonuclease [Haliscomenobacter sp.]|uniref:Uma2 family endonuclease n=1 Tax=Haliscomenobacter sp. TaxID=2717303 RepID=UPI0029A54465|nr:Uma2 family endonuclease [Haliscomenobacter sp.]MDX2069847.1 Uma2 family endonuclease [Haliscomenobacter sp.]